MHRLAIREGWATVLLTSLIVVIAVISIQRADWADGLDVLNTVMVVGLIAGFIVSKWRRVPSPALHLGGLLVGVLTVIYAMTAYIDDGIGSNRDKLRWLWDRGEIWVTALFNGDSAEDLYLFVLFISILTFAMAYLTMWFVFRARWIWAALFFPGVVLLLNLGYSLRVPNSLVAIFIFAALLLLMRFALLQRELNWQRIRIEYPGTLMWRSLWVASYLAIAVLIFGWAIPVSARSGNVNDVWQDVDGPWRSVEQQFDKWFVGLRGPGGSGVGGFAAFEDSFELGGPLSLSDDPVVIFDGPGGPAYIAAHTYNTYTGRGWRSDLSETNEEGESVAIAPQIELQPGESLPLDPRFMKERERDTFEFDLQRPRGSVLFTPGSFASANVGANLVLSWQTVDQSIDVQTVEQGDVPPEVWPLVQILKSVDLTPEPPPEPTFAPTDQPTFPPGTPPAATATPTPEPQMKPIPQTVLQEQSRLQERDIHTSYVINSETYRVSTLNYSGQFPNFADVEAVHARDGLEEGSEYEVEAMTSDATSDQLREAGQEYPDEVTARYLDLPDSVTERTKFLAQEIAAGSNNPYDISKALEGYLRENIVYSEAVAFPPEGVDVVDHVLFTSQEGYCEYYASAFVVMARSLGLPTRMSVGFFPTDEEAEGGYLYRERNAHAWPEVYFPDYGWIGFEPTAARSTIEREPFSGGGGPGDRGDRPILGGEGRDDAIFEDDLQFLEDNQQLPAGGGALIGQEDEITTSEILTRVVPLVILLIILVIAYLWLRGTRGLAPAELMYTKLNRGATWGGVRRESAMTPNEYADQVAVTVAGSRQPVNYLTDLYVRESYSPHKSTQADVMRARQAWLRLRGLFLRHFVSRVMFWRQRHDDADYDDEDW